MDDQSCQANDPAGQDQQSEDDAQDSEDADRGDPLATAPVRMSKRTLKAFRTSRTATSGGRTQTGGGPVYGRLAVVLVEYCMIVDK